MRSRNHRTTDTGMCRFIGDTITRGNKRDDLGGEESRQPFSDWFRSVGIGYGTWVRRILVIAMTCTVDADYDHGRDCMLVNQFGNRFVDL